MKKHHYFIIFFSLTSILAINTYFQLINHELALAHSQEKPFEYFQPNNPEDFGEDSEYKNNPNIIPEEF